MVEIISLHILKTGGTSFLEVLKDQYGEKSVYRYTERASWYKRIKRKIVLNTLSSKTRVLHGHFVYRHVEHLVRKHQPKIVVWFRDPVERVISRYYFLMNRVEENPLHPKVHMRDYSLLEFARLESQRNVQHKYIDGLDLNDLFFFGFLETFNDDLQVLAERLQWKPLKPHHKNDNENYKSRFKDSISAETRIEIRELNPLDVELYDRAWKMKREEK